MNDNRFVYNSLINYQLSTRDICGYHHYRSYYFNGEIHAHSDLQEISFLSSSGDYTVKNRPDGTTFLINRFGVKLG